VKNVRSTSDNIPTGQAYHTPLGYPEGITGKGKLKYSGENLLQKQFRPSKTPELSLDKNSETVD
jgi:hypothetical protein